MSWRQADRTTESRQRTPRRISHRDTETLRFLWSEERDSLCLCVSVAILLRELRKLSVLLVRNGRDLPRLQGFEESARRFELELWVLRLDAEEEPVAAG